MTIKFDILFKDQPALHAELVDSVVAHQYIDLLKKNYQSEPPIFRDVTQYTDEYLSKLLEESQDKLGWLWTNDKNGKPDRIAFHKNLENMLDKEGSFSHIPAELDHLIHEIHFCLHSGQHNKKSNKIQRNKLIIEWFNQDYVPLDDDFEFTVDMKFGDIRLQNPYVGHDPMQIYQEQDLEQVMRTCTFANRIKPGIHINLMDNPKLNFDLDTYKTWWQINAKEFVDQHGIDQILKYTGWAVIGRITNLDDLITCLKTPVLEFEKLEFDI